MSFVEAHARRQAWFEDALERTPRILLLLAIAFAWAVTLNWSAPLPTSQLPVESNPSSHGGYPQRIALPQTSDIAIEEYSRLVGEGELRISPTKQDEVLADKAVKSEVPQLAQSDPAPAADLGPGEFLPVEYDIATLEPSQAHYDRSDGSLEVRKSLYVDGVSAGAATIRIEEGAQILIATASVAKALGAKTELLPKRIAGALATGVGFIPFYELRGAGLTVEYDPVNDRVSLSTPS